MPGARGARDRRNEKLAKSSNQTSEDERGSDAANAGLAQQPMQDQQGLVLLAQEKVYFSDAALAYFTSPHLTPPASAFICFLF